MKNRLFVVEKDKFNLIRKRKKKLVSVCVRVVVVVVVARCHALNYINLRFSF